MDRSLDCFGSADLAEGEMVDSSECLELLQTKNVGRVAFTDRGLPQIFPVNFAYDGRHIIFGTSPAGALAARCDNAVIAFQVDHLGFGRSTDWTVLVVGNAALLTDEEDVLRARELFVVSQGKEAHRTYVQITPGLITGRKM